MYATKVEQHPFYFFILVALNNLSFIVYEELLVVLRVE
jgi:hypothetical protein